MGDLTIEEVMEKRIILRDKRSDLKKEFSEQDNKLKEAEIQCENWLLRRANENGVDSFKCTGIGTAYKSIDVKTSCADWPAFYKWVLSTGNIDALEKRVSRTFVKDFRKETKGELPPGVNVFEEEVMNVRRDNSIKEEA